MPKRLYFLNFRIHPSCTPAPRSNLGSATEFLIISTGLYIGSSNYMYLSMKWGVILFLAPLSVCPSVRTYVRLSVSLSVYSSVHPSVYPSVQPPGCQSLSCLLYIFWTLLLVGDIVKWVGTNVKYRETILCREHVWQR